MADGNDSNLSDADFWEPFAEDYAEKKEALKNEDFASQARPHQLNLPTKA